MHRGQSPFSKERAIPLPAQLSPHRSMPATQFDRSIDGGNPLTPSGGGGGGASPLPFDAIIGAGSDSSHVGVTVYPGTVNNLLPSNYTISADLSNTLTYYLTATVSATSGQVTGSVLSFDSSAPDAIPVNIGAPPASVVILLGMIVNGKWFRTIGSGSVTMRSVEVYRTSKTSPSPGTLPWDIYYTWAVLNA